MSFQSFGSLSATVSGGASFIAALGELAEAQRARLPAMTTPFATWHAAGATFQRAAAALTSSSRAVAPTVR